ncbi:PP2C family protein-serine/threonine phosphatase [Amycolatopsis thermophila]|uniref:Protein phosphatase n=1 Tax=Amycolatopsis thermophila TaxID=206084 RepID=A0ABU0EN05_9PSEU|nr:protein phosphatase 2C domain-containing protein [Amycolatopsis thermophila]MDQ0376448.1 protein phosphatase [Amycolatopsis thermophila]
MHRLTRSPVWGTATTRGPRAVNADATAAYTDPSTGEVVFALADGIGDARSAARAARIAVSTAVQVPASQGPGAALAAAQRAVRADPGGGDCVLVVASPFDGGYRVAWVGDARAYSWDGASLRQLTRDHTLAQYFRDRGQVPTVRMEHLVTTSVRTARPEEFGDAETVGPAGLLLTSDGVHKALTRAAMAELLRVPSNGAQALVDAALAAGGQDNATALMAEFAPSLPDLATTPLPTIARA